MATVAIHIGTDWSSKVYNADARVYEIWWGGGIRTLDRGTAIPSTSRCFCERGYRGLYMTLTLTQRERERERERKRSGELKHRQFAVARLRVNFLRPSLRHPAN